MKDSVIIEGKIYISSRRAAEIHKYSNDYIGQLCRTEKVNAKMIGRTWFVEEKSLNNHKNIVEESFKARSETLARNLRKGGYISSGGTAAVSAYVPENVPLIQGLTENDINVISMFSSKNVLKIASVFVLAVLVFTVYAVSNSPSLDSHARVSSPVALIISIPESAIDFIVKGFQNISHSITERLARRSNPSEISGTDGSLGSSDTPSRLQNDFNGIAVAPAASSHADNEIIKQKIRDSFSDNVEINPDESGTAGVITPVFRKAKGSDFVYVLVPVNEQDK